MPYLMRAVPSTALHSITLQQTLTQLSQNYPLPLQFRLVASSFSPTTSIFHAL